MPVPDDGNCFYHSLATYVRMLQVPRLRDMSIGDFRRVTTEYMEENIGDIIGKVADKPSNNRPLKESEWTLNFIKKRERLTKALNKFENSGDIESFLRKFNNANTNENLEGKTSRILDLITIYKNGDPAIEKKPGNINGLRSAFKTIKSNYNTSGPDIEEKISRVLGEIAKLKKDGAWASELGDLVPQYAAQNLNITLHIYDWRWQEGVINKITAYECVSAGPAGGAGAASGAPVDCITVNVLRVNDRHFELIFPIAQFKGAAKAIGGREFALMSKYNAENSFEELLPELKRITKSTKAEYTTRFNGHLANAELGLEYINQASTNADANASLIAECRAIAEASIAHIKGFIAKLNPAGRSAPATTRKKGTSPPRNTRSTGVNSVNRNVKKLIKELEGASLSNSSGSSSSGTTSALRRSRRLAKLSTLPRRAPTPPKSRETRRKPNNSAKFTVMTNALTSVGVNVTNLTKKQIQNKYSEFFEN
jgi:hypothetical protein